MSAISEQINELRRLADIPLYERHEHAYEMVVAMSEAADTIESLSAKLEENIEQSAAHYGSGWILCGDRMPEDGRKVLITARSKFDGELDIAISSWTDALFGGKRLGYKEWSSPWRYFHSNYEVIAWQPLPAPYKP